MKTNPKSNIENKKTMFLHIFLPMSIALVAFVFLIYDKDSTVKSISENKEYSIATIISCSGRGIKRSSASLRIAFEDKNSKTKIETFANLGTIPKNAKNQIGNKFVVVYNYLNPKECILLAEYPVKDSADFVEYIKSFNSAPPSLNKYYKFWWNKN